MSDQTTFNYLQHTQGLILWRKELPQDGNIENNNIEGLALATADSKLKINFMFSWNVPIWLPKLNPICIENIFKGVEDQKELIITFLEKDRIRKYLKEKNFYLERARTQADQAASISALSQYLLFVVYL